MDLSRFRQIWAADAEFWEPEGEIPQVVHCFTFREFYSGRLLRFWGDELRQMQHPPFEIRADVALMAFNAVAELKCFSVLGWQFPTRVIDLRPVYLAEFSGKPSKHGLGLVGAMKSYGLDSIPAEQKEAWHKVAMQPVVPLEQRLGMLDYCQTDTDALAPLLKKINKTSDIDIRTVLLWGEYVKAVARVELRGIPIDTENYYRLLEHRVELRAELIRQLNAQYGVYPQGTFNHEAFSEYLRQKRIPWGRNPKSNSLILDKDYLKAKVRAFPILRPFRELRLAAKDLQKFDIPIGRDGRHRCLLWPFSTVTGRNAPKESLYGRSAWMRGFIKPEPGFGLVNLDWSAQEWGTIGALAGAPKMIEHYNPDPFWWLAELAGKVPLGATPDTHPQLRNFFKPIAHASNYAQSAESLADKLSIPKAEAQQLLRWFRKICSPAEEWSMGAVTRVRLKGVIHTKFGWPLHRSRDLRWRTIKNFGAQANAADMMRLAAIGADRQGLQVCFIVHDAFLSESPLDRLEVDAGVMAEEMKSASRKVLGTLELRIGKNLIRYPDRYPEDDTWQSVMGLLARIEARKSVHAIPASYGQLEASK